MSHCLLGQKLNYVSYDHEICTVFYAKDSTMGICTGFPKFDSGR